MLILTALIAFLGWTGLLLQLLLSIQLARRNGSSLPEALANYLSFFTILTNLLIAVTLTICLLYPDGRLRRLASAAVTQSGLAVYIAVVGATYVTLLRHVWDPQGWQKVADILLHYVMPLLYVSYWLLFQSKRFLRWPVIYSWLPYPLAYLVYTLVRGALVNWYPYPFIDPSVLGYGRVAVNSSALLAFFLLLAVAAVGLTRSPGKEGRRIGE